MNKHDRQKQSVSEISFSSSLNLFFFTRLIIGASERDTHTHIYSSSEFRSFSSSLSPLLFDSSILRKTISPL